MTTSGSTPGTNGAAPDPALEAAKTLARWLDDRHLDPLLGLLLPGVGDMLASALGIYPVFLAWRRGAPGVLLARMLLNLAVDALGGAIPVVGDIWDFFFRAHSRNLALLEARSGASGEVGSRPIDTLVVIAAGAVFAAALVLPVLVVLALVRWLIN